MVCLYMCSATREYARRTTKKDPDVLLHIRAVFTPSALIYASPAAFLTAFSTSSGSISAMHAHDPPEKRGQSAATEA